MLRKDWSSLKCCTRKWVHSTWFSVALPGPRSKHVANATGKARDSTSLAASLSHHDRALENVSKNGRLHGHRPLLQLTDDTLHFGNNTAWGGWRGLLGEVT